MRQLSLFQSNSDYSRAQDSRTVHRLATEIPQKPYCSSNLAENGLSIRQKYSALEHSSIQVNTPWCVKYIILDIDTPLGLPDWPIKPTMIVLNPENEHYHAYFELETPVLLGDKANPKPQKWLRSIIKRLITLFGADPNYAGLVAKNPLHRAWQISPRKGRWVKYSLSRLEKAVIDVPEAVKTSIIENPNGRNCTVFDTLRHWAYREIQVFENAFNWHQHVINKCGAINDQLDDPLGAGEVMSIAKSVAKWCWQNRHKLNGAYVHRGVMGYGVTRHDSPDMPYLDIETVREHRRAAAERTNQMQRSATENRITDAIGQLIAQDQRVTVAAIARLAEISRQKIYSDYPHLLP